MDFSPWFVDYQWFTMKWWRYRGSNLGPRGYESLKTNKPQQSITSNNNWLNQFTCYHVLLFIVLFYTQVSHGAVIGLLPKQVIVC